MRHFILMLGLLSSPALAHELWLSPTAFQVNADDRLQAHIVNGEDFEGVSLAYLPQRFVNFILFADEASAKVTGRMGDLPALNQAPVAEGLNIAAYQATNATLNYENWDKFQRFVDHKSFGDVATRHDARGLPRDGFKEVYSRHVKALFAVGDGQGMDRRVGLETEIVALTNPYIDDLSDGMHVQVHYRNDLRADAQVEVFEKAPDGTVVINFYRTDDQGIASFPVRPGHRYMVDAVVLRVPSGPLGQQSGAAWETLWANLTFAVPE